MNALSMPAKRLTAHFVLSSCSLRVYFALSWRSLGALLALLPVSFQAERRERVEILRGMIAHKIDRPRADEKKRRRDG
jgi:hypothetical protein